MRASAAERNVNKWALCHSASKSYSAHTGGASLLVCTFVKCVETIAREAPVTGMKKFL